MFKIFRNFFVVIRSYKLSSLLNVAGLTLAFATAILIAIQATYEYEYDSRTANAERIYRVDIHNDEMTTPLMSMPLLELISVASPHIEAFTMDDMWARNDYLVSTDNENFTQFHCQQVKPEFFTKMVMPELLEGSFSDLDSPGTVAIPQSVAQELFGSEGAVGRVLNLKNDEQIEELTVAAVYQDFQTNSIFYNSIYQKFTDKYKNNGKWNNICMNLYLMLDNPANADVVRQAIEAELHKVQSLPKYTVHLLPIRDIYFANRVEMENAPKGNQTTTNVMIIVAVMVVLIACVNFVNFSTAIAPRRMKSITIYKIFGSSLSTLRLTILSETVIFCFVAGLLSLLLVWTAEVSFLQQIMIAPIDIFSNVDIVLWMLIGLIAIGIIAGLFPTYYLTTSGDKTKQSFGTKIARNFLLGFQYIVSVMLVIVSIFMWLQNEFVAKKDLGFDYNNVLVASISDDLANKNRSVLESKLKESPLIEDVAFTIAEFPSLRSTGSLGRMYKSQRIDYNVIGVTHNFPKLMGIEIVEGRDFRASDQTASDKDSYTTWLFNSKAKAMFNTMAGDSIDGCVVAGATNDYNYHSLGNAVEPLALMCQPDDKVWGNYKFMYCKYNAQQNKVADLIRSCAANLDPGTPLTIMSMNEKIAQMYTKEDNQVKFISIFSLLAIVISLSGVLSLVLMEIKNRTKEVGVRKVYGATTGDILAIFNRKFIVIAFVCSLLALFPAYLSVSWWLEQYVYKIEPQWWVYAVGSILVLVLTMCVVTICCWNAANQNPVKSIKTE